VSPYTIVSFHAENVGAGLKYWK